MSDDTQETPDFIKEMVGEKPSPSPGPSGPRDDARSGTPMLPPDVAREAAREAAMEQRARADAVDDVNRALEVQRVLAEARQAAEAPFSPQYGQQPPQQYYQPPMAPAHIPEDFIRQSVQEQLEPYVRDVNAHINNVNERMIISSLNVAEARAREKFGDADVDAAIKAAIEKGVNRHYCEQYGADAYNRLLRDYAEVEAEKMGSGKDFFGSMFAPKSR